MQLKRNAFQLSIKPLKRYVSIIIIAWCLLAVTPAIAQDTSVSRQWIESNLQKLDNLLPTELSNELSNDIDTGIVYLDGRRLFLVTSQAVTHNSRPLDELIPIEKRVQEINAALNRVVSSNFEPNSLEVSIQEENKLPVIYAHGQRLFTVTTEDARLYGVAPQQRAENLLPQIQSALIRAKQERQPEQLRRQGWRAVQILIGIVTLSLALFSLQKKLKQQQRQLAREMKVHQQLASMHLTEDASDVDVTFATAQQIAARQQRRSLNEVQKRLLQVGQACLWLGGSLLILGLFPYTRWIRLMLFASLRIPVQVVAIAIGTYVAIRFSSFLVSRFFWVLEDSRVLSPRASKRLALRLSTFSGVFKSVSVIVLTGIGMLWALSIIGIPVGPLLTGAGIIGLGVSFASQSLIKDIINGFFILSEDQYAVGDVVEIDGFAGYVENLNLRITQLRDTEGKLITIPNSAITIVQNLSNEWSRVDLNVPVAYSADLDKAMHLILSVAERMMQEPKWKNLILESPDLMGTDEFGDRGLMVKIWIKTQPLQQWNVAREYRRRIKIEFDNAGISIPFPQYDVRVSNLSKPNVDTDNAFSEIRHAK